jgi:FKBP-type peptidyl-prolyl cis-trans isomerase FkpA
MSVTAVPLRPLSKGTVPKLWIGILLVALLGAALAWVGTSGLRYTSTDQGISYRALSAGTGDPIGDDDVAQMHFSLRGPRGEVVASTSSRVDPRTGQVGGPVPVPLEGFPEPIRSLKDQLREGSILQVIGPASKLLGADLPPNIKPEDQVESRLNIVSIERGAVSRARALQQQQMQQRLLEQQMMEEMRRGGAPAPGGPGAGTAPPRGRGTPPPASPAPGGL